MYVHIYMPGVQVRVLRGPVLRDRLVPEGVRRREAGLHHVHAEAQCLYYTILYYTILD